MLLIIFLIENYQKLYSITRKSDTITIKTTSSNQEMAESTTGHTGMSYSSNEDNQYIFDIAPEECRNLEPYYPKRL